MTTSTEHHREASQPGFLGAIPDVSARQLLAERVAEWVCRHQLTRPYGGRVVRTHDNKKRAYYSVSFSVPLNLDASVGVYSEKFLLVRFQTRYSHLPSRGSFVFHREADLYEFLDAAFVNHDEERVTQILETIT